jgi:hypothetical protein
VIHGGVIAEACHQITGSRRFAFVATENCSITRVVRPGDGRWFLLTYNETGHLVVRRSGSANRPGPLGSPGPSRTTGGSASDG